MLCAVSGGKDSMYLLEQMGRLAAERGFSVACAHFDHRLRGQESDRDRSFVENYCRSAGIPCYVGFGDVADFAAERGMGLEEAARQLRYEFLEKTAAEIGAVRIATAHTAQDNAETLLLNLLRGSGLKGLCGIPPVRGIIIRPMLETDTEQVLAYLAENNIPHVEDSSNSEDDFARNRLRHRVLPLLEQENPAFYQNLSRCVSLLRQDEKYLSQQAQSFIDKYYSEDSLPVSELAKLPEPVFARVMLLLLGGGLSQRHIDALGQLVRSPKAHGSADVPGMRVGRRYDRLLFKEEQGREIEPQPLEIGKTAVLGTAKIEISCKFIPNSCEIHNSFNIFSLKSDSICGKLTVRSRSPGDKLRLCGRNCTKTLKKLFSEAKLNDGREQEIPVICDELGVVAVSGFGIAQRCCPSRGDDLIVIEVKKQPENQAAHYI